MAAVQMQVRIEDYASPEAFAARINHYMEMAAERFESHRRLVVFPEDVGLGWVFLGDYEAMKNCASVREVAHVLAVVHGPGILLAMSRYPGCGPARALLLARGDEVRSVYSETFSRAAREFGATVVAGSAPIAGEEGNVHNVSFVFGPDGELLGSQRKVHLTDLELQTYLDEDGTSQHGLDLSPGALEDIHAIETPAGRIGVAICLDAFNDDVVDRIVADGARILVQPSFNPKPWDEWQANDWRNGAWAMVRKHYPKLIAAVNPMMVGGLWEIKPEGLSSIVGGFGRDGSDGYLARARDPGSEDVISATMHVPMP